MIMTNRLYYDNAYLKEFDAVVTACEEKDGAYHVRLDRSAFYPTSGGQPFDTGTLGGAHVTDVYVGEDHDVYHVVDAPLEPGRTVRGEIDWPRRFDHMQQHAADHMIASALWRLMGGVTIGLHISHDVSTIDVAMPEGAVHITEADIARLEDDVNNRVQRDVPVRCWFPEAEELKELPLRKPPTVSEHVRVVAIGEDEMVACGGTHPSSAGQLGLVKILGVEPARGKMRVSFLAGMRALGDYRQKAACANATAALLSTGVDQMAQSVKALQDRVKQAEYELRTLKKKALLANVDAMLATAPRLPGGIALLSGVLEADAELLKDAASHAIRHPGVVALLGVATGQDSAALLFARSEDVPVHMGRLLNAAARPLGGKGGGRPDFAQGGGSPAIIDSAVELIKSGNIDAFRV